MKTPSGLMVSAKLHHEHFFTVDVALPFQTSASLSLTHRMWLGGAWETRINWSALGEQECEVAALFAEALTLLVGLCHDLDAAVESDNDPEATSIGHRNRLMNEMLKRLA